MRIAINLLPYRSFQGTETFTVHLLRALFEVAEPDQYEFMLLVHKETPDWLRFDHPHVRTYTIRPFTLKKGGLALYQQTLLYRDLHKIQPDLLLSTSPSFPLFYPHNVVTIHDAAYKRFPEFSDLLSLGYFSCMFHGAGRLAKHIFTVSDFSKKELATCYNIDLKRISVLSEGAPNLRRVPDEQVTKTMQKYGVNAPYFFYIGITRPRKNIPGLLDAFAQFRHHYPDYTLILAGKIDDRFVDVASEIKKHRLSDAVIQTGFVSSNEKAALYQGATALMYPSFYEGFGLPVLEAQSIGVPVLTSNTSALPDTAGHGACLVDPYDPHDIARGMTRIAHDAEYRRELVRAGKKNVDRFSWHTAAKRALATFASLA